MTRLVEMLEQQLCQQRFARAARAGDHAERGLKFDREHHVAEGFGVCLRAEKKRGMDGVGERIFAQSVVADEIAGRREREDGGR